MQSSIAMQRRFLHVLAGLLPLALLAASCGGGDDDGENGAGAPSTTSEAVTSAGGGTDVADEAAPGDEVGFAGSIELTLDQDPGCELLGPVCLLPFPSDALTIDDASTVTGRRVALPTVLMPMNSDGVLVDPARQNRADGFSPGSAGLVLIPGLDPSGSALAPITDIARSLADDSGSVVLDATTGERWPHWAELDANATDPERRGLFVRPAQNYVDGHRIVIGLRNLVDESGAPIEPTDTFRAYRDRLESGVAEVEERRPAMERVFADLEAAGVSRDELVVAWEFTVISTESLTGPLVHMRDDAFAILGDDAPAFSVDAVSRNDDDTYTVIEGTYDVPLYLTNDGSTGNGLNLTDDPDLPTVNGTFASGLVDRPEVRALLEHMASPEWGRVWASTPQAGFLPANRRFVPVAPAPGRGGETMQPAVAAKLISDAIAVDRLRLDGSGMMPPSIGFIADGEPGSFFRGMVDWADGRRTIDEVFADIDADWAALRDES